MSKHIKTKSSLDRIIVRNKIDRYVAATMLVSVLAALATQLV